jgi:hypothetical protein
MRRWRRTASAEIGKSRVAAPSRTVASFDDGAAYAALTRPKTAMAALREAGPGKERGASAGFRGAKTDFF